MHSWTPPRTLPSPPAPEGPRGVYSRQNSASATVSLHPHQTTACVYHVLLQQNEASRKLNAAKAALNKVNTEMNEKLAALSEVCADLATLLQDHPEQWLLSAADLSAYQQQDVAARQVFER